MVLVELELLVCFVLVVVAFYNQKKKKKNVKQLQRYQQQTKE
jgi:hypothetical protein